MASERRLTSRVRWFRQKLTGCPTQVTAFIHGKMKVPSKKGKARPANLGKVVIVGAGPAGLAAAKHLQVVFNAHSQQLPNSLSPFRSLSAIIATCISRRLEVFSRLRGCFVDCPMPVWCCRCVEEVSARAGWSWHN